MDAELSWETCQLAAVRLHEAIQQRQKIEGIKRGERYPIWGIPRGGGYVAALLSGFPGMTPVARPEAAQIAVDDILDTGQTAARVKEQHGLDTLALVDRAREPDKWPDGWIVFPWEGASGPQDDGETVVTRMLQLIGEDPKREGLEETPKRVVSAWKELYAGYGYTKPELTAMLKLFPYRGPSREERISIRNIPFVSTCEHHLMPFTGSADVVYVPRLTGIIGLSKVPRIVDLLARRLQVQERLTQDIADVIGPAVYQVSVTVRAQHTCLSHRGHKVHGVEMETTGFASGGDLR